MNGAARGVSTVGIAGTTATLTLASAGGRRQHGHRRVHEAGDEPAPGRGRKRRRDPRGHQRDEHRRRWRTPFTMLPNGDVATSNMAKSGTTFFFDAIDETIALTDNGTTLIRNSGTAGSSYVAQLTDTPGGFVSMSALTMDIRVRTTFTGTPTDDQVALFAQVFRSDGVTPLTNEVTVGTNLKAHSSFVTLPNRVHRRGRRGQGGLGRCAAEAPLDVHRGRRLQRRAAQSDDARCPRDAGRRGPGTPPVFQSAAVNGSSLTMTYNEALNTGSVPANGAFSISGSHSVTGGASPARPSFSPSPRRRQRRGDHPQLHQGHQPDRRPRRQRRSQPQQRRRHQQHPAPGGGSLTLRANGDGTITPAGTIAPSGT